MLTCVGIFLHLLSSVITQTLVKTHKALSRICFRIKLLWDLLESVMASVIASG